MPSLTTQLRNGLESAVAQGRNLAEAGAQAALEALAVHHHEPYPNLAPEERRLRNHLRARARQLGDRQDQGGRLSIEHLAHECAYEHWHHMLFARFLAENHLLIEPESAMPISLAEAEELAREANEDLWTFASRCAQRMLPRIFRPDDPLLRVRFAPEHRLKLEHLLAGLDTQVFTADDSLGWVYQFWQSERKRAVNDSGVKIGADELPAVTQLFTEDYMVLFLLHNTLGAWWAGKALRGAAPEPPPGRLVSPDPSLSVCPPGAPALAGTPGGQTVADASHGDPERLVTEDDLRKLVALPGIEWTYLRFVRTDSPPDSSGATAGATGASATAEERSRQQQDEGSGESATPRAGSGAASPVCAPLRCWRPAAGTFDGWPRKAKELRLLDPCMGSGHFVVFELPILVAMRMAEEGLSRRDAVDAVLRDNLFGLELDPRCTQLAAFNLALAAWKLSGYHDLPPLNLACCGLGIHAPKQDWLDLARRAGDASAWGTGPKLLSGPEDGNLYDQRLRAGMEYLYDLFQKAPTLGSLINPGKLRGDLLTANFAQLAPLLAEALGKEAAYTSDEVHEMAVTAQGLAGAARLLAGSYHLVATNVPYLGRGKQDDVQRDHIETHYPLGKADLATAFVLRCLEFCGDAGSIGLVTPQNWLFLGSYRKLREYLLKTTEWGVLARLGPKGFQTPMWDFSIVLAALTRRAPAAVHAFTGVDVGEQMTPGAKDAALRATPMMTVGQNGQLSNPDARIALEDVTSGPILADLADYGKGSTTGDSPRFLQSFWESPCLGSGGLAWLDSPTPGALWSGRSLICTTPLSSSELTDQLGCRLHGQGVWGRRGVVVNKMSTLEPFLYAGEVFDDNVCPICARDTHLTRALLAFVASRDYRVQVRVVDQALKVTAATLTKIPFDLAHWQQVAAEKYPHGLPKPHSDDPTQWLFHGHPNPAVPNAMINRDGAAPLDPLSSTLQVAVARLLGYRWPRQTGSSFPDCQALGPDGLEGYADADGIVCIPSVRGERTAAERLRAVLAAAFGPAWSADLERQLLAPSGAKATDLDAWLRDEFFEQHCRLFHHRPFVWHIWDGRRRDGFHALVNYHRLAAPDGAGRRALENLTYSYLGDWITRQEDGVRRGEDGADDRLAAAVELRQRLEAILAGEPPFDLFVRWKPLARQPSGWEPDINDGVRLNLRPFLASDLPNGKKGAGILRWRPNVNWSKDRGTEPMRPQGEFPWFWSGDIFTGERLNDIHLTTEQKRAARDAAGKDSRP